MAVVGGAGLFAATDAQAAPAATSPGNGATPFRISVLGTTDLHGNVYNWDYFRNKEYDDSKANDIGVAKAASLISMVRAERGADRCITLDAGDTIQGTPLAYYYAKIDPITGGSKHPMATAMNALGYDAAALGNHEYNYGLDTLRAFEDQCNHPLLSANSVDWNTGQPVFTPYVLKRVMVPGDKPITVGILVLVRGRAALPGERQHAARRAGARHRRDPRRSRPRRDRRLEGEEQGHRPRGAAQRAALLGHAGQRDGPEPAEGARQ